MKADKRKRTSRLNLPVSVLMPVCNEADIIDDVLQEWINEVMIHLPSNSELIFDDCSSDGTEKILQGYEKRYDFIRVNWGPKDGFFNAARRLYQLAGCPLIFFTDSDGQYVASEFWKVAADINDHDMVHGVKAKRKDPLFRIGTSAAFNIIAWALFGSRGSDINSAFRLMHRRVLDASLSDVCHMPTLINAELYLRAEKIGFNIKNINVEHRRRKYGKSRGLPHKQFLLECYRAYGGLINLRAELAEYRSNREFSPCQPGEDSEDGG